MIRRATINDAQNIFALINEWSKRSRVLDRSLSYIYEHIRDFWVYEDKRKLIGCCSLHIVGWQGLGEIKSLVVKKQFHKRGIGKALVEHCIQEAKDLGLTSVFALTFAPGFFARVRFRPINRNKLPHKIWSDCVNCVFFPDCKEEALILKLK
jgi:amino-acid N-acetyltransferase